MCHLILLLPILALPLFWFLPMSVAAPAYGAVLIVSVWVYVVAMRAMQRPVQTGVEALVHHTGEVIGQEDGDYQVRLGSEIWNAESKDKLQAGDPIEAVSVEGLRLRIRRSS
jgi:membrane protein implicated in regulation of membrane protease activity